MQGDLRRSFLCLILWAVLGFVGVTADGVDRFVSADGTNDVANEYTSWAGASTCLQTAIDVCDPGDTVRVENGFVTDSGGRAGWPSGTLLTNRIVIDKAITVRSESGDTNNPAVIVGAWDQDAEEGDRGCGPAAVRCVYLVENAVLVGFMLTNGATWLDPEWGQRWDGYGGGAYGASMESSILSNCVVTGNTAEKYGGGVYGCNVFNSLVSANRALDRGGGAYASELRDTTITLNHANSRGGGIGNSHLHACTVIDNTAVRSAGFILSSSYWVYDSVIISNKANNYYGAGEGGNFVRSRIIGNSGSHSIVGSANLYDCCIIGNTGGASFQGVVRGSTLYGCRLIDNYCGNVGGAAYESTLYNSLIAYNEGNHGGGVAESELFNCTLYGNTARGDGGGAYNSVLWNSISWDNNKEDAGVTAYYSCGEGALYEVNNSITNNPLFVGAEEDNFRLQPGSPCIDEGEYFEWMDDAEDARSKDLDGLPRIRYKAVDMGAYEFIARGVIISVQ